MLRECSEADGLLLLDKGRRAIIRFPAKLYEYLRLRKPILALTDAQGDTARVLAETGGATVIDLLQEDAIHRGLPSFLESGRAWVYTHFRTGSPPLAMQGTSRRRLWASVSTRWSRLGPARVARFPASCGGPPELVP